MAKAFNPINFPAGFNIDLAVPIDSRVIVDTKSSLTSSDYWMDDTYPIKLYNGLICAVQDSGEVYVLMNKDNYTVETSWKKVGSDIKPEDIKISWGEIPSATPAE
jgi:hypothetical protein